MAKHVNGQLIPKKTRYLRLVGQTTIPPTRANRPMSKYNRAPFLSVDDRAYEWGALMESKNTRTMQVFVYDLIRNGLPREVFASIGIAFDLISFETQK